MKASIPGITVLIYEKITIMSENTEKVCELCEEQPATLLCSECCRCYCDGCNKLMHAMTKKKGHKTEAIPEGVIVGAMCPLHNDNPLEMFCVDEVELCCGTCTSRTKDLHKGHNVVKISEIPQDNEVFSAAEVRKRFADALKSDDELSKNIEGAIDSIRSEWNDAREKVRQTFTEAHKRLEEEEAKVMEELESACNESEEALQKNLEALREVHEYSIVTDSFYSKVQGGGCSRLMELNLVSTMEKQRKMMEEVQKMKVTALKIGWNSKERKLSFTKTAFSGISKLQGCVWKKCPDNIDKCMKYSVDEENPRIATKIDEESNEYWETTLNGSVSLPINTVTSWSIKILKSKENDGNGIFIGIAPSDIDLKENIELIKCGWYFDCHESLLYSGPPHKYRCKPYGPRKGKGYGEYVHTGDSVGVVMDTAKGELSFVVNGVNLGVAFEGIPLDKPLVH